MGIWEHLFYDKCFNGNNSYGNDATRGIDFEVLQSDKYIHLKGVDAIKFYNTRKVTDRLPENINESFLQINVYKYNNNSFYTMIGVNKHSLEKMIEDNITIPHLDILYKLCRFHISYTNASKGGGCESIFKINRNDIIRQNIKSAVDYVMNNTKYSDIGMIQQPKFITAKLYDYQKRSIYWMKEKEKEHKKIKYNVNDEVCIGNVYFDVVHSQFRKITDRDTLTFYGGGIIDEVGLGKTVQVTTLSILNQPISFAYIEAGCEYIKSKATLIICPNHLCLQWARELNKMISKDHQFNVIMMLTKVHFDKYTYQDVLDADYVILSFNFLNNKAFASKFNKFASFDKEKFDHMLFEREIKSLGKNIRINPIKHLTDNEVILPAIHWHRLVVDEYHEIGSNAKYIHVKNVLPHFKSTHRWSVTGTPFINNSSLINMIDFITGYDKSSFGADEDDDILLSDDVIEYIRRECFRRNTKDAIKEEFKLPPVEEVVKWLKFAHTERMMYNAYLANPNNDKFSVYLRQLCCHPNLADETKLALSNCKTLKDIEKTMVEHNKKQMDLAMNKVLDIESRVNKIKKKIRKIERKQLKLQKKKYIFEGESDDEDGSDISDGELDDIVVQDVGIVGNAETYTTSEGINIKPNKTLLKFQNGLNNMQLRLDEAKNVHKGKETTFNFFNNVVNRIKKKRSDDTQNVSIIENETEKQADEDVCCICLDEIPEDDIGVTKCGHLFCYDCLKTVIPTSPKCPVCATHLKIEDIYMISYEQKKKKSEKIDKGKEDLINEVGTKLANLIIHLRTSKKHTIIFFQWNDLLQKVGDILEEYKIKNVFCRGSCFQRDKAIREFDQNDDIRVIMLSSESAASGANLTKATEVILLDPVYGDFKFRKDTEHQAIGRAHRLGQDKTLKVIRFVIHNSIEEDIYKKNVEEDKKYMKDGLMIEEIEVE